MALYSVIASIDLSVLSLSQLISGSMTVGAAVVATPLIRKWRQLRRDQRPSDTAHGRSSSGDGVRLLVHAV